MYTYGPTTVELVSTERIVFSGDDLQEGVNDWADWIHRYAETLTKLMNREELEEFNRRLLR
jgi:CBS-domain-containing membrane protein